MCYIFKRFINAFLEESWSGFKLESADEHKPIYVFLYIQL